MKMGSRAILAAAVMALFTAFAPAEEVVYVVNSHVHSPPGTDWSTVAMLRGSDLETLGEIELGDDAHSAVLTPDGSRLWVSVKNSGYIAVIDTSTFEVVDTIEGGHPMGFAFTPDGSTAYVCYYDERQVAVVDVATGGTLDIIERAGWVPCDVVITPDGSAAYVIEYDEARIDWIRTADNAYLGAYDFEGHRMQDAVISPDGGMLYACVEDTNRVERINLDLHLSMPSLDLAPYVSPRGIAISPDGNYLFVGHNMAADSKVTMWQLDPFWAVVAEADIDMCARRLAMNPAGTRLYASDHNADECRAYRVDTTGESMFLDAWAGLNPADGYHASPVGLAVGDWEPPADEHASNYINLEVDPDVIGGGVTGRLTWGCDFSEWDYEGAPLDVYLAVIRDPVVANGPCTVEDALAGGEVWLYGNRREYAYTGPVREQTWRDIAFPPVAYEGGFSIDSRADSDPRWAGEWAYAVCFIRRDTGAFVRPDLPVEVSNLFTLR